MNTAVSVILRILIAVLIIVTMFKIMHWPFVGEVESVVTGVILITYFVRFSLKESKEILDFIKLFMVVFWVLGYVLNWFDAFGGPIATSMAFLLFSYWFIVEGFGRMVGWKNPKGSSVKVAVFFIPAMFIVLVGAIFKTMHWPGASLLLVLGLTYSAVGVLIGVFKKNENEPNKKVGGGRKFAVGVLVVLGLYVGMNVGGHFAESNLLSKFVELETSLGQQNFERSKEVEDMYDLLLENPVNHDYLNHMRSEANNANAVIESVKGGLNELAKGDMSNQDIAVHYFLIADNGQKGRVLLMSIKDFKAAARSLFPDSLTHEMLEVRMSTKDFVDGQGFQTTWVQSMCEHLPLASVLANLSLWQNYIQDAEMIALDETLSKVQAAD